MAAARICAASDERAAPTVGRGSALDGGRQPSGVEVGVRVSGVRDGGAYRSVGAVATAIVPVAFAVAKFALGAWIVMIMVPVLVHVMLAISRTYSSELKGSDARAESVIPRPRRPQRIIVAAPPLSRAVVQAVRVGQTMAPEALVGRRDIVVLAVPYRREPPAVT